MIRYARRAGTGLGLVVVESTAVAADALLVERQLGAWDDGQGHFRAIDAKVKWCSTAAQCGYDYLCDVATSRCYPPRDCQSVRAESKVECAGHSHLRLASH